MRQLLFAFATLCLLSATLPVASADTAWIKPGTYWKCPDRPQPDKPCVPGLTFRIQPRYSLTQDGPALPTWGQRDDNSASDDYNTRRLRLAYIQPLDDDWVGFAHVSRDWGAAEFQFQDLFLTYGGWKPANITIGEMMAPFDRPYLSSDFHLPLAERPLISTILYPDRQIGVMLHNTSLLDNRLGLYAGVYAGSGLNEMKMSDGPMPVFRAEYSPIPGLNVAASWAHRHGMESSLFSKFLKKNKSAYGLESLYAAGDVSEDTWGLDLLGQYDGWTTRAGYTAMDMDSASRQLSADGWYLHVGKFVPFRGRQDRLELVAGYEEFDPNTAVTDQLDARFSSLGLTYHVKGYEQQWRLQYTFRDEGADDVNNNTLALEYDYLFKR